MSYSKTTWKTGDTITAALLNHAEDGIAANDAAIAAIPEGMQLYGPYYATSSQNAAISAGERQDISCDTIYDMSDTEMSLPSVEAIMLAIGATTGGGDALLDGYSAPYYATNEWVDAYIGASNVSDSSVTVEADTPNVTFYSTVELQPASDQ